MEKMEPDELEQLHLHLCDKTCFKIIIFDNLINGKNLCTKIVNSNSITLWVSYASGSTVRKKRMVIKVTMQENKEESNSKWKKEKESRC